MSRSSKAASCSSRRRSRCGSCGGCLGRLLVTVLVLAVVGTLAAQSVFAAVLNLGFVLFSAQLPLVTGNLHSVVDCALIGLALSAFRSETLLRDTAAPVPQIPEKETV